MMRRELNRSCLPASRPGDDPVDRAGFVEVLKAVWIDCWLCGNKGFKQADNAAPAVDVKPASLSIERPSWCSLATSCLAAFWRVAASDADEPKVSRTGR